LYFSPFKFFHIQFVFVKQLVKQIRQIRIRHSVKYSFAFVKHLTSQIRFVKRICIMSKDFSDELLKPHVKPICQIRRCVKIQSLYLRNDMSYQRQIYKIYSVKSNTNTLSLYLANLHSPKSPKSKETKETKPYRGNQSVFS
jgi:hypothetical protein